MIITHNDLDGIVSALVVCKISKINPLNSQIIPVSYDPNRSETFKKLLSHQLMTGSLVSNTEDVWFTDLSLTNGELDFFKGKKKKSKWRWCDHHKTSEEFDTTGIFDDVILKTDEDKSAAELLLETIIFRGGMSANDKIMQEWVDYSHKRDMWDFDDEEDRKFCMKLEFIVKSHLNDPEKNPEYNFSKLVSKMQKHTPQQLEMLERDRWTWHWTRYENSVELAKKTIAVCHTEPNIVCCYTMGYESDVSHEILKDYDNHILVMLGTSNSCIRAMFRTSGDYDMSIIASAFNGGGHKKSAGGRLLTEHLIDGYNGIAGTIIEVLEEKDVVEESSSDTVTTNKPTTNTKKKKRR